MSSCLGTDINHTNTSGDNGGGSSSIISSSGSSTICCLHNTIQIKIHNKHLQEQQIIKESGKYVIKSLTVIRGILPLFVNLAQFHSSIKNKRMNE